jgi:myo-inositol-1(or 4)-monophosphatase
VIDMSLSRKHLQSYLDFAKSTAVEAGGILKKRFNSRHRVEYKGRIDPVTEADVKAEEFITDRITRQFPDHTILAEEGSGSGEQAEFRWVIDPLDGTVNYAHGFPVYCVSIALEHNGELVIGAVYDPERDELFHGARGLGSRVNRERLQVANESNLERALLATGFGYNIKTASPNNLGYFARMAKKAQGIRRAGSAAIDLCWLAAGRLDGYWELYLHPWDTAAAVIFVEEAGGKVTRMDGRPYSIFDDNVLAANAKLHRAMKRALSGK